MGSVHVERERTAWEVNVERDSSGNAWFGRCAIPSRKLSSLPWGPDCFIADLQVRCVMPCKCC